MRNMFRVLTLLVVCTIFSLPLMAQTTVVYLVRHAEKDLSDPGNKDPVLTGAGLQRAADLNAALADQPIAAVFSTNYKRTLQTAAPLVQRLGLTPQIYDPKNADSLASVIRNQYKGKRVLIIGHSNTLLPQIRSFGAEPLKKEIADAEYNNLFKITMYDHRVTVEEGHYGQ